MGPAPPFSPDTLRAWSELSIGSAKVILPLVFALTRPRSVVDVGCLYGGWAATCLDLGVDDVIGVDGEYIERDALLIPRERFHAHDLTTRLRMERTFDLAISLEVAHYLPQSRSEPFVADLCALAPVVLFSAAIPHQGGVRHINEQWPAYWVERFAKQGYSAVDCVRDAVWDEPAVGWWYAQNAILFASNDVLCPAITKHPGFGRSPARVHPALFTRCAEDGQHGLRAKVRSRLAKARPVRAVLRARKRR